MRVNEGAKVGVFQAASTWDNGAGVEPLSISSSSSSSPFSSSLSSSSIVILIITDIVIKIFSTVRFHHHQPSAFEKVFLWEEPIKLKFLKHLVAAPFTLFCSHKKYFRKYPKKSFCRSIWNFSPDQMFYTGIALGAHDRYQVWWWSWINAMSIFQLRRSPECFQVDMFCSITQQLPEKLGFGNQYNKKSLQAYQYSSPVKSLHMAFSFHVLTKYDQFHLLVLENHEMPMELFCDTWDSESSGLLSYSSSGPWVVS